MALRFDRAIQPGGADRLASATPDITQIAVPVAELLATALPRLKRQQPYAGPLARGGQRARALETWLDAATSCLNALAHPSITLVPVHAHPDTGGVMLDGRVHLGDAQLGKEVAAGGSVTAYLLTLGLHQADALAWFDGDYGARHVQADLAREVLFALGRRSLEVQRGLAPGARPRRISVQTAAGCGDRKLWDPAQVQALLGLFDSINPGVTVSDTGCFQPLDSLLGLTIAL